MVFCGCLVNGYYAIFNHTTQHPMRIKEINLVLILLAVLPFHAVADINPIMGMKNSSNNSSSQPSNPVGISTSNTVSLVTTNTVIPNKPMSLATRAKVSGKRDRDPDAGWSGVGAFLESVHHWLVCCAVVLRASCLACRVIKMS